MKHLHIPRGGCRTPGTSAGGGYTIRNRQDGLPARAAVGPPLETAMLTVSCRALFAVVVGALVTVGGRARAADIAAADREILADGPVALWRFEEPEGAKNVVAEGRAAADASGAGGDGLQTPADTAATPRATDVVGAVVLGEPGPRPPRHLDAATDNRAVAIGGSRGYLRCVDAPDLRFAAGDAITIEAWVYPFEISEGQQVYIIGKGRTGRPGVAKDNQNWALRLAGARGAAAVSFLFRSADNRPGQVGDFHRWTSTEGFEPDSGWHHVAVSYTFGVPDSIRGFIDGRPVSGAWDYGGATAAAPVVDDDEVWIGSALGGGLASTFPGLLDSVAVHRRALPPERIAARWRIDERIPAFPEVALEPVPDDAVLFEILERVPDGGGWSFAPREPTERFTRTFFAMTGLPQRYDASGLRADRSNPFIVRVRGHVVIPEGPQRITVRTRGGARVFLDGAKVAELKSPGQRTDGHEKMFEPDRSGPAGMRFVQPGDQQAVIETLGDGERHVLRVDVRVGGRGRRPETGEFSASIGPPDAVPTVIHGGASAGDAVPLTDAGWTDLAARLEAERIAVDTSARRSAAAGQAAYWERRHAAARAVVASTPGPAVPEIPADHPAHVAAVHNDIDRFINARLVARGLAPAAPIDDAAFVRRLSLDVRGIVPEASEVEAFLADGRSDRRARLVDAFLADPRWADHWVGYWQDVLAENPNLVNPTLNNTGPFRFWIHESFLDRKPIDRMVTELVLMEGSTHFGGPAGFALATENDAPFAAKAHVLARAFMGMEMNCARCHDAPNHPFVQQDLFSLAAMLKRGPQKVPATSSVPGGPDRLANLAISVTLEPGSEVAPEWPFADVVGREAVRAMVRKAGDPREELAALLTAPANTRFAEAIVNRLWERLLGRGLVANPDDWDAGPPSHPDLLAWLGRELVLQDYGLEKVARTILLSHTYARGPAPAAPADTFAGRAPRRLSAEQVVDSLAIASGKPFDTEPMNIDIDTSRQIDKSLNLGLPTRAWQFAALGNERDRPSLSLPFAQHYVTLMEAFGWRGERQAPLTHRDVEPTALQPAVLANGVVVKRASQFSDSSGFTRLALDDRPLDAFIDGVFLRILSRRPTDAERGLALSLLQEGYAARRIAFDPASVPAPEERPIGVSWSNHVTPEANIAKQRLAVIATRGDPPTPALDPDWRERAEDLVWSLFNTPEFVFVP
jgi:hypothetical protein